jgi:AraC-like DNA-binding protein
MLYKIDLFAIFIFLGIVQAIFLSTFFFSKENRKSSANIFQGLLLISFAFCILEIFLMYTGYIIHCLYLVDFSEPFSFFIGPSLYLMILCMTREKISKWQYLHLAFGIIYFLLIIPFFLQPEDVKFNSWIESYKPDLPFRPTEGRDPRIFWITDYHTEATLVSLAIYAGLSLIELIRVFRQRRESFFNPSNPALSKLKAGTLQITFTTLIIVAVKIFNYNDTGDHLFAAYIALIIYLMSFRVMRQSGFFQHASLIEPQRYKSSTVTDDQQKNMIGRLTRLMSENKPFLKPDFSLPELAQQLGTSVHVLSQVINVGLGKSFFEMTAEYRVEEAKRLLKTQMNIKVEEIAEQVGYNSKSSFNTAFKKITGQTPSAFRTS